MTLEACQICPWGPEGWGGTGWPHSPVALRSFLDGLKSPLVALIVGPEKQQFTVHEAHLCEVEWFKIALTSGFKESREKVIRLPEESPLVVEAFLAWLLRCEYDFYGTIWLREGNPSVVWHALQGIVLADKWNVEDFKECCYRVFWSYKMKNTNEGQLVKDTVAAWQTLQDIRTRFLPIHVMLVLRQIDHTVDIGSLVSEDEVQDPDFWADFCTYEKAFDLVQNGKPLYDESVGICLRVLIADAMENGKPCCEDILDDDQQEKMSEDSIRKVGLWLANIFVR